MFKQMLLLVTLYQWNKFQYKHKSERTPDTAAKTPIIESLLTGSKVNEIMEWVETIVNRHPHWGDRILRGQPNPVDRHKRRFERKVYDMGRTHLLEWDMKLYSMRTKVKVGWQNTIKQSIEDTYANWKLEQFNIVVRKTEG